MMKTSTVNRQSSNVQAGFTLVELLVSIFIFSVIMLAVGSAFVSALNVQRRAFNVQQVLENASYVIDTMLKEVRVSQILPAVPDSCATTTPAYEELTVEHPDFGTIRYYMSEGNVMRENAGDSLQLNSNTVVFTNFKFCISGTNLPDAKQSRVTFFASMKSTKTTLQELIDIQTTLSPRYLNK
jgi:prepilin-type N-terminal cleavage/methylation domain-containing protein